MHLGHIYAQPTRYWYRLRFERRGEAFLLTRIDYVERENTEYRVELCRSDAGGTFMVERVAPVCHEGAPEVSLGRQSVVRVAAEREVLRAVFSAGSTRAGV
jgi:hypothetical protein